MERVFKIKTKSEPDLANQYPSERRYSASIVIGLSAVLLQFSLCSMLMGLLIIHKMSILRTDVTGNSSSIEEAFRRISDKLDEDMEYNHHQPYFHYYINVPALVAAGCFIMAFGDVLAFITGIFAWKRWYIDHNITFFFLSCSFSSLTSSISLLISILTTCNIQFDSFEDYEHGIVELSPLSLPLVVNIVVLSLASSIWSFVATNIAYKGMRKSYPDDIVKGGRVEVSTVKKGNQTNISNIPIEVINNFAVGKLAKYLPKKENNDLPKQESNDEYQQRVNNFLSAEPELEHHEPEAKQCVVAEQEIKVAKEVL